jgi:hypothetical protein
MPLLELVKDRLWEYENFLTEEEVNVLLDVATSAFEEDWYAADLNPHDDHYRGKALDLNKHEHATKIIKNIDLRVANLFLNWTSIVQIGSIVRNTSKLHPVGLHRDNEDENMIDNRNAYCRFGILMYLNSDFDGGEICYPEYGIEYKPKRGVLIHHAGNLHGVKAVNSGTRYSMTSFVSGLDARIAASVKEPNSAS